jgi:23S rRNA (cytosine1962-C5)-methyltransferase
MSHAATSPGSPARLKLTLTATAESIVRGGHPWVYSDSIRAQNRAGTMGELAVMYDRKDKFLAVGLFDPDSPLRVRVLHAGKPTTLDDAWWQARLSSTLARRAGIADAQTNGLRLINGESDGWPGLVLDRYDTTLVLKLYTAAWLPRLAEVTELVVGQASRLSGGALANNLEHLDWRTSNQTGGTPVPLPLRVVLRLSRNIQAIAEAWDGSANPPSSRSSRRESAPYANKFKGSGLTSAATTGPIGFRDGQILHGPPLAGMVTFLETGIRFESDVLRGQKTGFFLDQRENRRRVESFSANADVLNAFSFSGGFSLYAARGGAKSVTDLDISQHALAAAERNFQLNHAHPNVVRAQHRAIQADAFEWLEQAKPAQFDVAIVDPPSLAKREAERAGAIQAYGRLAANGIRLLRPRGVLVAASCSAHVSAEEFFSTVRAAASRSSRRVEELGTALHAPDHAATIPEAQYLKCIYLRLG